MQLISNLILETEKTHQMNYTNSDEALREVELDIKEGADVIIVKPAMSYLDIISKIKIFLQYSYNCL